MFHLLRGPLLSKKPSLIWVNMVMLAEIWFESNQCILHDKERIGLTSWTRQKGPQHHGAPWVLISKIIQFRIFISTGLHSFTIQLKGGYGFLISSVFGFCFVSFLICFFFSLNFVKFSRFVRIFLVFTWPLFSSFKVNRSAVASQASNSFNKLSSLCLREIWKEVCHSLLLV